jgi:hypothetical protein
LPHPPLHHLLLQPQHQQPLELLCPIWILRHLAFQLGPVERPLVNLALQLELSQVRAARLGFLAEMEP